MPFFSRDLENPPCLQSIVVYIERLLPDQARDCSPETSTAQDYERHRCLSVLSVLSVQRSNNRIAPFAVLAHPRFVRSARISRICDPLVQTHRRGWILSIRKTQERHGSTLVVLVVLKETAAMVGTTGKKSHLCYYPLASINAGITLGPPRLSYAFLECIRRLRQAP